MVDEDDNHPMRTFTLMPLAALLTVMPTACHLTGPGQDGAPTVTRAAPTASVTPTTAPAPTGNRTIPSPAPETQDPTGEPASANPGESQQAEAAMVARAREFAARHLGLEDPRELRILQVEPMTWDDASMGCPQEGMMYAQVVTEGFRITLQHPGGVAAVHLNGHNGTMLIAEQCGAETTAIPTPPSE